jgi:hypothetical protein
MLFFYKYISLQILFYDTGKQGGGAIIGGLYIAQNGSHIFTKVYIASNARVFLVSYPSETDANLFVIERKVYPFFKLYVFFKINRVC